MNKNRSHKKQFGFSLIEVMIALIIMSVGMLGIAGLYITSMQAGRTSLFRHHAVTLAGDIADRIRANPTAAAAYEGAGAPNNCVPGVVPSTDCTPAEMAANDILLWRQQATDSLQGTVTVVFTAAVGATLPTYGITVTWNEAGEATPPSYAITIPVLPI